MTQPSQEAACGLTIVHLTLRRVRSARSSLAGLALAFFARAAHRNVAARGGQYES